MLRCSLCTSQRAPHARQQGQSPLLPAGTLQELGEGGPGDWLSALRMGTLAAFVLDEPLARWTDRVTGCEVCV